MKAAKRIRKWWLCRKYHICPVHGTLMTGYAGYISTAWVCDTCVAENEAKNHYREECGALERVDALNRLNRDWALPTSALPPAAECSGDTQHSMPPERGKE